MGGDTFKMLDSFEKLLVWIVGVNTGLNFHYVSFDNFKVFKRLNNTIKIKMCMRLARDLSNLRYWRT